MTAKCLAIPKITLGVCYYPEHWPESLWRDDFRRMREMGLSIVRMAEFAWSIFEPEEGRFDFSFFDRVMDLAREYDLQVVLGTPTATPPAWLTFKYPEVLNATRDGVLIRHGQRRHCNYNAPIYRRLSQRIASKMAEHYACHPALIGWQIDNEFNCDTNVFYAEADHAAFREWLRAKYGSLDSLNDSWGAVFWNQTYSSWEQVRLTSTLPSGGYNPHQALDEKRFISHSVISYASLQAQAIREHDSAHFITTNGIFAHIDNHALTEQALDFLSYDSYPLFYTIWPDGGDEPLLDRGYAAKLSTVRDVSPIFCVTEQQAGPGGSVGGFNLPSPKPGQLRLWTYQSIAHGADMVLFFRWRTATFGTEIYWHGINDYHNQPNRRCAEVARVSEEIAKIGAEIAGATVLTNVAIVRDYDNEWDGEYDIWHGPLRKQSEIAWQQVLQRIHTPHDFVTLRNGTALSDLSKYACLIYPHAAILPDETAQLLKAYVEQGGTIVFGCRTGYKDERGHCPMRPLPGPVADLCGVRIEDFTWVERAGSGTSIVMTGAENDQPALNSGPFNDILRVESDHAEIVATYGPYAGYYAGKPALVANEWGRGKAYYYGGVFTTAVVRALSARLGLRSPIAEIATIPPEVELVIRAHRQKSERYVFLLNYSAEPQHVLLHSPAVAMLTGAQVEQSLALEPYGVAILRIGNR